MIQHDFHRFSRLQLAAIAVLMLAPWNPAFAIFCEKIFVGEFFLGDYRCSDPVLEEAIGEATNIQWGVTTTGGAPTGNITSPFEGELWKAKFSCPLGTDEDTSHTITLTWQTASSSHAQPPPTIICKARPEQTTSAQWFESCHQPYCALWRFAHSAVGADRYRIQRQSYSGAPWVLETFTENTLYWPHLGQNALTWRIRGEGEGGVGDWTYFTTTGQCGGGGGGGLPAAAPPDDSVMEILEALGLEQLEH